MPIIYECAAIMVEPCKPQCTTDIKIYTVSKNFDGFDINQIIKILDTINLLNDSFNHC